MKKVVKYVTIVVIVTQEYHLYRALYIANQLGLEAYGVGSDPRQYVGATYRELREILARNKDFVKCIFKPEPTYLGDTIAVSGNGDATNDKEKLSVTETNTDRTIDKVSMTIKEGTLTKTGATVIIKDENENPYNYEAWYRIDKNENGEWKELDAFAEVCWIKTDYQVKEDGTLELEEIWKNIYGELEKGQYRLVKSVYEDDYKYFYAEFNID
jgi:hypothetical protein